MQEENNLHDFNSVSKIGLFFFLFVLLFFRPIGLVVFFRKIKNNANAIFQLELLY